MPTLLRWVLVSLFYFIDTIVVYLYTYECIRGVLQGCIAGCVEIDR